MTKTELLALADRIEAEGKSCTCEETLCPASDDNQHCVHWYDGNDCHLCGEKACPNIFADDDEWGGQCAHDVGAAALRARAAEMGDEG